MSHHKLKPCPFRRPGEVEHEVVLWCDGTSAYVECLQCSARGPEVFDNYAGSIRDEAVRAWNNRSEWEIVDFIDPPNQVCLVWVGGRIMMLNPEDWSNWFIDWCRGQLYDPKSVYWQPLPEPPEVSDDQPSL